MSILAHPDWRLLRWYLRVERYSRDTGPNGARVRLEVDRPSDGIALRRLLAIRMPCVGCGRQISPVRTRQGLQHLYYAPTCPLNARYGCSRGRAAREEYLAVRAALDAWRQQQRLGFTDES